MKDECRGTERQACEVADGLQPITLAEVTFWGQRDGYQRQERVTGSCVDSNSMQQDQLTKDAFPFTSQLPLVHPAATTN